MKALIVGCGNIGSVAAEDLAKSMNSTEIVVSDKNEKKAQEVAENIDRKNVSWTKLDIEDNKKFRDALEDFDLVMGFLPGKFGCRLVEICIDAGKDLVDVSYMPENPLTLDDKATKNGVTVVPDCGLAPGISNVLVGHAIAKLDRIQTVQIMVGGLPEKAAPPLGYLITWSPENLIDEYMRKAAIVKKGRIVEVEALSGLEEVDFQGLGKLEAFYTDGLRTLAHTVKGAEEMGEKTLRYSGHAEKIRMLKSLGFFEEKQVDVEGVGVSPRKLTVKLFEKALRKPEVKDVVALNVEVKGLKDGRRTCYSYQLLDRYDEKLGITAMARTTAYPASIVAQLLLRKAVKEKGVVPPENIGKDDVLFKLFMDKLDERKVRITENVIKS